MADSVFTNSMRSVGEVGGTVLVIGAVAAAVMTAAIALMVLAIGGGAAAVTAATGVVLMEIVAPNECKLPQTNIGPATSPYTDI